MLTLSLVQTLGFIRRTWGELFERSGNRMVLTSSGDTFKHHALDIVESTRKLRLELDVKNSTKNDYEGLSLYGMPLFTGNIVPSLVRQLFCAKDICFYRNMPLIFLAA